LDVGNVPAKRIGVFGELDCAETRLRSTNGGHMLGWFGLVGAPGGQGLARAFDGSH
jgi:hypothetical protein